MAQALNWPALIERLRALKAPIDREIRNYPTPIAGCDAHFNYLLEERAKLARELVTAEQHASAVTAGEGSAADLKDFVRQSEYLGQPAG